MNTSYKRKSKAKKDVRKWWDDRIKCLSRIKINDVIVSAENIYKVLVSSGQAYNLYEKGVWTCKKLAILQYYLDIYTKIMKSRYSKLFYFDLFSGSGLIKLKSINKCIFGSALLSILIPLSFSRFVFDKFYFVEISEERANTLEMIIEKLKEFLPKNIKYEVICKDMNEINYEKYMGNCDHSLVVIDPEGIEPKWKTVSSILSNRCDVIFTFMTSGIQRLLGKNDPDITKDIEEFLGEVAVPSDVDTLIDLYIRKIISMGKQEVRNIPIDARYFKYNIIIATRKTRSGNPWLGAIDNIVPKINIENAVLEDIFRINFGIQSDLSLMEE